MTERRQFSILFCCMGNICRSPTAEGVVRQLLRTRASELFIELDSAGTHDYHIGAAPDVRAVQAAQRRGIDLAGLRARQVLADDFTRFDLVLAMDEQNLADLRRIAPVDSHPRIKLVMDYAPELGVCNVPDPYYGSARGFEEVLDLLQAASEGLLADLLTRLR
jgi:protein-tyrosine phosphatase